MADAADKIEANQKRILSPEQDALLDMYINSLDTYFEEIKNSEKVQVEVETLHLKRILSK